MEDMLRLFGLWLLVLLCGCASISRNALPEADYLSATVLGDPSYRYWGDEKQAHWLDSIKPGQEESRYTGIRQREHNYLLLSGGGANGAFGAGVLSGWSDRGTRPEFTLVTGVSTGALTAPFAFLGKKYDPLLRELFTQTDTDQILEERGLLAFLNLDAATDTQPLRELIEQVVTDEVIEALAVEGRKGRDLLIGTTNLDAGRPVVWNITRMASSSHPEAPGLIRQVLLASAAIPGIFPPVYIPVDTPDGRRYDEMHVDGGTSSQFFFYPSDFDWSEVITRLEVQGTPHIYVIRNGVLRANYQIVAPSSIKILQRTVESLIRTQGIGDFFRIWSLATRDGLEFQAAFIPDDLELGVKPEEMFDPVYMRALFKLGYSKGSTGQAFHDVDQLVQGP